MWFQSFAIWVGRFWTAGGFQNSLDENWVFEQLCGYARDGDRIFRWSDDSPIWLVNNNKKINLLITICRYVNYRNFLAQAAQTSVDSFISARPIMPSEFNLVSFIVALHKRPLKNTSGCRLDGTLCRACTEFLQSKNTGRLYLARLRPDA